MDDPAQPRRRRTGLFLGLSLALNLVVIGAIIGALLLARGGGPERPGAELRAAGRLPVAAMLPPDARAELREGLRAQGAGDKAAYRAADRAHAERLDAALRAEPFDPALVAELFAERRAFRGERAAAVDLVLVEVLAGMNADDRAAFADRMRRHNRKKSSRKSEDRR
ncbi:MAG: periplasmic heavy metal sensor [Rhodobacteraceae bacterium]|nr:periplasmic heavy metal sensor [Paracoccaceae bacterium]